MNICKKHKDCQSDLLKKAHKICEKNGAKMTNLREKILEIIFQNHKPVKAYQVLEQLAKKNISDKPPTIYRALDFFIKNKIIHKISSINSYITCSHIDKHNNCHFAICKNCDFVEEICDENLTKIITNIGAKNNFQIANQNIEISGLCKNCATKT